MKSISVSRILVPYDLKEESKVALHQALYFGSISNAHIILLHVISTVDADLRLEDQMHAVVKEMQANYAGEVSFLIEKGDLVDTVSTMAKQESCDMIIMPTHGLRGWQHVSGSLALRIISETNIPCIVVQQREIRKEGFKKIVVPIHWRSQVLEELPVIIQMAKQFNGEVHLISPPIDDQHEDANLLEQVEGEFTKSGVVFTYHQETDRVHFAKKVARYAAGIDADLICSINFSYEYLYTLMPRSEEEDLIYNDAQIPVLLLTPQIQDNQVYIVPFWH
jgi:nucleotide-binding universal stress UspA family protein